MMDEDAVPLIPELMYMSDDEGDYQAGDYPAEGCAPPEGGAPPVLLVHAPPQPPPIFNGEG